MKEFQEHPARMFADEAIVLQALRTGTRGYQGEENLGQWVEKTLRSTAEAVLTRAIEEVEVKDAEKVVEACFEEDEDVMCELENGAIAMKDNIVAYLRSLLPTSKKE